MIQRKSNLALRRGGREGSLLQAEKTNKKNNKKISSLTPSLEEE